MSSLDKGEAGECDLCGCLQMQLMSPLDKEKLESVICVVPPNAANVPLDKEKLESVICVGASECS